MFKLWLYQEVVSLLICVGGRSKVMNLTCNFQFFLLSSYSSCSVVRVYINHGTRGARGTRRTRGKRKASRPNLESYFTTVISRVVELYPPLSTSPPSSSTSSSLMVCLPAVQPLSQIAPHLSMYLASPPSTEYRTRYVPPSFLSCAFPIQKSIMIGSLSTPLYSPLGRL